MYNAIIFSDITDSIVTTLSLGPYKCAHVLRQAGYTCLVVNHLGSWNHQQLCALLDDAVGEETFMVGFSTTFLNLIEYDDQGLCIDVKPIGQSTVFPQGLDFEHKIIQYLLGINPKIKTMVGGAKTGPNYSNRNIDYVLLGYSEISLVNLMRHLHLGEPLNKAVKNIWGRWIIDDRFAKDYDFPRGTMKWLPEDVVNHLVLPIEIARGCIFRCKFCAFPMNGKKQLDFVRTPEVLYDELKENFERYGIRHYIIVDDTFNDHTEKLESLLNMINRLDFKPVFWGYHRLDLICTRPETLDLLYKIGVRSMYFGIETLHQPTGRVIGKGFDRQRQIEMIQRIKQQYPDISMHGSFIIGLPNEPVETIHKTYEQIISQQIPLDSWNFQELRIDIPEDHAFYSEITLTPEKFGYENLGPKSGNSGIINWRNQHLDSDIAVEMVQKFMSSSKKTTHLRVTGHTAMHLSTMGVDFDKTRNTSFQKLNWHQLRTETKPGFEKVYRDKIASMVKEAKLTQSRKTVGIDRHKI